MRSHPALRAVALAALVVVAGCALGPASPTETSPTAEPTTTQPSPTPAELVTVRRGELPVDADRVYRRVQGLRDLDVAPPTVFLSSRSDYLDRVRSASGDFGPFLTALEFEHPPAEAAILRDAVGGLTLASGNVVVYVAEDATPAMVECLLAHEYVHVLQVRAGVFDAIDRDHARSGHGGTLDAALARRATTEGAAVYVEHRYARQFGSCDGVGLSTYRDRALNGTAGTRLLSGPYYHGWRYVTWRVDDPANLSTLYERPPLTTEQVLHNYSRDAEPPASLTVRFDAGGTDWQPVARRTLGELAVRATLAERLPRERAVRAAAGWGNDTVLQLSDGGGQPSAFAWVTRWDSAGDADEFATALRAYLDARFVTADSGWEDARGRRWAVRRTGERTVTLVLGPPALVEDVTVRGSGPVVVEVTDGGGAGLDAGLPRDPRRALAIGSFEVLAAVARQDDRQR